MDAGEGRQTFMGETLIGPAEIVSPVSRGKAETFVMLRGYVAVLKQISPVFRASQAGSPMAGSTPNSRISAATSPATISSSFESVALMTMLVPKVLPL